MSCCPEQSHDGASVTVHLPMTFRRRGGRKRIVVPAGTPAWVPAQVRIDGILVKALARAHRWQRMLDRAEVTSVAELAHAEKINPSYLARTLRLTLLAPEIVEAILDGRQPATMQLNQLFKPFPLEWDAQRQVLDQNE